MSHESLKDDARPADACHSERESREGFEVATRIRASCGDCGDVELCVRDVEVRVCTDDNAGSYVFRCPSCDMAVVKDAEPRVVDLLLASGVSLTTWSVPAELHESRSSAPAFTHDDLLDFHHQLDQDDWFDRLVDSVADGNPDSTP
jgi:hypothetical protein